MENLNQFNRRVTFLSAEDDHLDKKLSKVISVLKQPLKNLMNDEGLYFSIILDSTNTSLEGFYEDSILTSLEGTEVEFSQISYSGNKLLANILGEIKAKENTFVLLDTRNWRKEGDLALLVEIDKALKLAQGFCSVLWIRKDWNDFYKNQFRELQLEPSDKIVEALLGGSLPAPEERKIDFDSLGSSSVEVLSNYLSDERCKSIVPDSVYSPKKKSPELYDELLSIYVELQAMGYWDNKARIEEYYKKHESQRKQLERKVSLLKHILLNLNTYDFCL